MHFPSLSLSLSRGVHLVTSQTIADVGAEYRIDNQKPHHREQSCVYRLGGEDVAPYRRVTGTAEELSFRIHRFEKLEPSAFHKGEGDVIAEQDFPIVKIPSPHLPPSASTPPSQFRHQSQAACVVSFSAEGSF